MHIFVVETLIITDMRKLIILSLICMLSVPAFAQGRLLESSSDKRPVWVKKDVDRYDLLKVGQSSNISLENAKELAFEELRNFVANSITTYLIRTNVEGISPETIRKRVEESAYLNNISDITALQIYWEHRLYKKKDLYKYYILYDFNDNEKKKAALEINKNASNATRLIEEL